MAHFPDLSPYEYNGATPAGVVNVGWLDRGQPFRTAVADPELVDALTSLAADAVMIMRGLHDCAFCDEESPIHVSTSRAPDRRAVLGTGEIRIEHQGTVFSAPTLVVHYVGAHDYRPPDVFIEAIRLGRQVPDDET